MGGDLAVVRDWQQRVRQAAADGRALRIRGGRSKAFLDTVRATPASDSSDDPIDTTRCSGEPVYEPSELVVTAPAGMRLASLERLLADHDQMLAFDPPRFADGEGAAAATVGGMVAAGLAGPSRATAGNVRDHLLGATLLDGRGRLLDFGGQVMKNVAGYDVARLLAGSWGTLGIVVGVSLKVLPRPRAMATLRLDSDEAGAIVRLNRWGGQPLPLRASAWWQGRLVVQLAGADAAVGSAVRMLGGERLADGVAQSFWEGLRDQRDEFFAQAARRVAGGLTLWRLAVPSTTPPLPLGGHPLIEWGGALRWLVTDLPAAALQATVAARGGHALAWRVPPGVDRAVLAPPLTPPIAAVHARLKAAFDPHGVFNPGGLHGMV